MLDPQPLESNSKIIDNGIAAFRRRKKTVFQIMFATIVGVYCGLFFVSDRFEAEARLLVKLGRENAEVPLAVDKGGVYATGVQKEEINSYVQLLKSRGLIEATVDAIGPAQFTSAGPRPTGLIPTLRAAGRSVVRGLRGAFEQILVLLNLKKATTNREKAIQLIASSLSAVRERDSNVIIVTLRLPDRELALTTLRELLTLYRVRHVEARSDTNVLAIFDNLMGENRDKLRALQDSVTGIKQRWNLSSVPEQRARLLERLGALRRENDEDEGQYATLMTQQQILRARVRELPSVSKSAEVVGPSPRAQLIKQKLTELQLERIKAAGRYEAKSAVIEAMDKEIAGLQLMLDQERQTEDAQTTYQPAPLTEQFKTEIEQNDVRLAGLQASIRKHRELIQSVESELQLLNHGEVLVRMAELDRNIGEEKFLATAKRRVEAGVEQQLDLGRIANVALLGPPTAPEVPVYPNRLAMLILGAFAGLILGTMAGLVAEWRDDRIYDLKDLTAIEGVASLGRFSIERNGSQEVARALHDRGRSRAPVA